MIIEFRCPNCKAEVEADDDLAGTVSVCPNCGSRVLVPQLGIHAGRVIGGFRVREKLGSGAMGEVWRAFQTSVQRDVALKILAPALTRNAEFVERFTREVRVAAKLDHPNIVSAFDAGEDHGILYLAVSFVDGENLQEKLQREGPMNEADALHIIFCIADALRYTWDERKILHRDIKPANIMISSTGVPKLMDLGVCKQIGDGGDITLAGVMVGTPYYMSPEQARGMVNIDFRSDIYSLGATLFHLVTGEVPFPGDQPLDIAHKHLYDVLPDVRAKNPRISQGCAHLVNAMMAKKVEERHESWQAVLDDIDRVQQHLTPQLKVRRRPVQGAAGGSKPLISRWLIVAMLMLLAGGVWFQYWANKSDVETPSSLPVQPQTRDEAEAEFQGMWDYAESFANENAEDFDGAINHFLTLRKRSAGTHFEMMAQDRIRTLKDARAAHLDEQWLSLKDRSAVVFKQEGSHAALKCINQAAEWEQVDLEPRLQAYVAGLESDRQLEETLRQECLVVQQQRREDTLEQVGSYLLDGDFEEAISVAELYLRDSDVEMDHSTVSNAVTMISALLPEQVDRQIIDYLRIHKRERLALVIRGKKHFMYIDKIEQTMVYAQREIASGRVGVTFLIEELSLSSRAKIMRESMSRETFALQAVAWSIAENNPNKVSLYINDCGSLTEVLVREMESRFPGWICP